MADAPKVFISHSDADKERFVTEFATILREKGIDAWVDEWEILPGDSLVDRIFRHGLANAAAVIAVISKTSISSKWVAEELDVAQIKRIEQQTRLIPMLIDQVPVPENLKHLRWVSLQKEGTIENAASRIIDTVYGVTHKPQIGPSPGYTSESPTGLDGLQTQDVAVLRLLGDEAARVGHMFVHTSDVLGRLTSAGISTDQIEESLEVLEHHGMIRVDSMLGTSMPIGASLTSYGFQEFAKSFEPNYSSFMRSVVADLVNNQRDNSIEIEQATAVPRVYIHHILDVLKQKHLLSCSEVSGRQYIIGRVSRRLERILRET